MEERRSSIFSKKSLVLITGASRGFGRILALTAAPKFPPGSVFALLARSVEDLGRVKAEVERAGGGNVRVVVRPFDQGQLDQGVHDGLLAGLLAEAGGDPEQALIVHNAGTLGDVARTGAGFGDIREVSRYFDVNLSGMVMLNSGFLQGFGGEGRAAAAVVVVNISSLCAVQATKNMSLYCAGKAGRDMFFQVLALEHPTIRVLNYAPGPLDTDMQTDLRTNIGDPELKSVFEEMKTESQLVRCEDSAEKLLKILEKNTFKSGDHIDYFHEI